jgi:hypothetical protein
VLGNISYSANGYAVDQKIAASFHSVGANLLAKNVKAMHVFRQHALSFTSIASNRASTGCSYKIAALLR